MPDLILAVKEKYFREIEAGTKVEEYRLSNLYWRKRLDGKTFDRVIITLGYPKKDDHARRLIFPWNGFVVRENFTHEFFGDKPVDVFAITLKKEK